MLIVDISESFRHTELTAGTFTNTLIEIMSLRFITVCFISQDINLIFIGSGVMSPHSHSYSTVSGLERAHYQD